MNSFRRKDLNSDLEEIKIKSTRWCSENIDLVMTISAASLSLFAFVLTLKKVGPHIQMYREKLIRMLADPPEKTISYSEAIRYITTGNVQQLTFSGVPNQPGTIHLTNMGEQKFKAHVFPGSESTLFSLLNVHVPHFQMSTSFPFFNQLFTTGLIPLASMIAMFSLVFNDTSDVCQDYRQLSLKSHIFSWSLWKYLNPFRPSVQQVLRQTENVVTFADVITSAKDELYEIVHLFNDPERFAESGASCPRGILLTGPSGVGKTMLARAVAEEVNARFISCSAASFVELYVGRGAKRVRTVFEDARRSAPCILFIDELDALGCRGDPDVGDQRSLWIGHDEYVQTLNQLLTEMDGFQTRKDGVLVIAATNRLRYIDPALLRCGRFDRWITLQLPTHAERYEILKVSVRRRGLKLTQAAYHHLTLIAQRTSGWCGAELDTLINEAAFATCRRKPLTPTSRTDNFLTIPEDLEQALLRITTSRVEKEVKLTSSQEPY